MPAEFSAADLEQIERSTQELGRFLFAHEQTDQAHIFQRRWWDDRIMAWAMQDESVKVQMFRFIDVLPMLRTSSAIVGHLHEYFADVKAHLPAAARLGLAVATPRSLAGRALALAARRNARSHAQRFIAGTNVAEVLNAARRERKSQRAFTLDVLGEAVTSEDEAERYLQSYLDLIAGIAPTVNHWPEIPLVDRDEQGPLPRVNVSVKLSALDSQFDAIDPDGTTERVARRLRQLLRAAREHQAFVNVDMESYGAKSLTLHIFQQVLSEPEFRDTTAVGIVIQCYLHDSEADLVQLRDWAHARGAPVWVRLVKGAYWDYETVHAQATGWPIPVFQQKWESDANYERLTRFAMLNHRYLRPALGSHNLRSLAHGMAVAQFLGLPKSGFELQMLYGMADNEKQAIVEAGHRLRIYMPYGELIPGMAYLVRRLLENTSNDSFLRASFSEQRTPEVLLADPAQLGRRTTTAQEPTAMSNTSLHGANLTTAAAPLIAFHNEPPTDFSRPDRRESMHWGLESVKSQLGCEVPLWIAGAAVASSQTILSLNPSLKSQLVGRVAAAEHRHVEQAVAAAKQAWPDWAARPAQERADFLRAAAAVLRRRKFELAAWEVLECGKPWREADGDLAEAIDFCEYYARGAEALLQPRGLDVPGEENRFEYRPRGVAAIIAPWNFPLAILTGMTTAALATGNTVIMKPSEQSSVVAAKLMEVFVEIGLPAGVANYLPGRGEVVGSRLVEHPDVALIAFTGSREVGLEIQRRAADVSGSNGIAQVKKVIAEMGGKNAIIVDSDADLDEAVLGVMKSAFGFQGQKCSACSRCIVLAEVYDPFVARLVAATRSLKVGPAEDPATSVGPVIDEESWLRIQGWIERAASSGKEALAVDVGPLAQQGYFVGPHIYQDVAPNAAIAQEEIFGPVLAVLRAADMTEALALANSTKYALTGGVFSRSPANLERCRREFVVGNLYLNRPITGALVGRQPFGGFKLSGIGSQAGGPDYLLQFVLPITITENTMRRGFAPESERTADRAAP
ncbi:MAG TPA: proline dehydrogenase family protein [Pirellulales bacterium]|jgi:RHH-type proline utilization regulon transcriptional repressor/proline dehydrogenase/delta 1-pyrroline-5-carboxylate dehydrogenase|nr:proline dehydrogenase family protein [Pirellulales bacterium]